MAWLGSGSIGQENKPKTFGRGRGNAPGSAFGTTASISQGAFSNPSSDKISNDNDNPFASNPTIIKPRVIVSTSGRGLRAHDPNINTQEPVINDSDNASSQKSISKRKIPSQENYQKKKKEARALSPLSSRDSTASPVQFMSSNSTFVPAR